jgi:replication fork clamp-binding protein CrfC
MNLARRNVENMRWSTLQNLNISFASFTRSIRDGLNETMVATKGAMEAAFLRKQNYSESSESEVNRFAVQITVLEEVKKTVAPVAA